MAEDRTAPFKDHFSTEATAYAAHRPTYPEALANYLAGLAPSRERALDCGCGNGQFARLLAGPFAHVVATDASAAQIAAAEPHPKVTYRVAPAEASGLPARSVDLIAAAQAAHWFDLPAFYAEAQRIARPGAVLALISYGVLHLEGAAEEVLAHFYTQVVGPYWPPERAHVEAGYRSMPFPFAELPAPDLAIERDWSLEDLVGYVGTWSALRGAQAALGHDPLAAFAVDLAAAWGPQPRRRVRWPLALRLTHL